MSQTPRMRLRPRWRTMFLFALTAIVGWSVYSYWTEYREMADRKARETMAPPVGAHCMVQLQNEQQVSGSFLKLNDDWLVLQNEQGSQFWVVRGQVLLLEVAK